MIDVGCTFGLRGYVYFPNVMWNPIEARDRYGEDSGGIFWGL